MFYTHHMAKAYQEQLGREAGQAKISELPHPRTVGTLREQLSARLRPLAPAEWLRRNPSDVTAA
jgi:protein required for attachment to host cells